MKLTISKNANAIAFILSFFRPKTSPAIFIINIIVALTVATPNPVIIENNKIIEIEKNAAGINLSFFLINEYTNKPINEMCNPEIAKICEIPFI